MKTMTQQALQQVVDSSRPERLSLQTHPPVRNDHSTHLIRLIHWGHTTLAADHLLFPEMTGQLCRTVAETIRRLNLSFVAATPAKGEPRASLEKKVRIRQFAYEALIEMALNFCGLESRWLREDEKTECLHYILAVLSEWENRELSEGDCSVAAAVLTRWLAKMKRVQKGNSMVAKTASRIGQGLEGQKNALAGFLGRAEREIQTNIYYRMVKDGLCKFGNDYALGLRWLRHLGFEQVSTNPVLAARAYQDEPDLVQTFLAELKHHPPSRRWLASPATCAEEIALFATFLALWDNLHVFRPIFFNLREQSGGGVVSFQLNPNIAHLVEESIRDVFHAFSLASENLYLYDQYLLAGYRPYEEQGRPNLVIKVAATSPAAREITRTINAFGFGSNITVDFSVSQEAILILEEMDGMARAIRKGIRPTQLYMTNMGGRLESHLREVKLEELFGELKKKVGESTALRKIERLAEVNGTREKVSQARVYEEKALVATRFAQQKKIDDPVCEALKDVASKEQLKDWEEAISRSGTLVVRRIWWIFFSPAHRDKWISHLMKKHQLTRDQAGWIMDRIHALPASKRKPFDSFWTLSSRNLVHTEFPDHQENVRRMAEDPSFRIEGHKESITHTVAPEFLDRLNQMEDFRRAYEINPELASVFKQAGIEAAFGLGGLGPSDWPAFGPVQKTLSEFKGAYDGFQKDMIAALGGPRPKTGKKAPGRTRKGSLSRRR